MNSNPNSDESAVEAVATGPEGERGQGDTKKVKCSVGNQSHVVPSSADGTSATGALKEALLLQMKLGGSRLETARMASLAKIQAARRIAWNKEVKKELEKRAECKQKMEAVPMGNVTNWEDKQSMSKVSLQWRDGFKRKRTSFLFHEVFPVLIVEIPGLLELNDILQCRIASKEWKDSIDLCVSSSSDFFGMYRTKSDSFGYYYFHHCFTNAELVRFNKWSENIPLGRNPFFTRRLLIGSHLPPLEWKHNLGYWREMEKLLQRWGRELWMATFYFNTGMGMEMVYEMLVKYLTLMPNLRRLQIFDQDEVNMFDDKIQMSRLKERMARKPLPELPDLRTILLNELLPHPMVGAMLAKYGNSLESVTLEQKQLHSEQGEFTVGSGLPKMKKFSHFGGLAHSTFDFPSLEEIELENYNAVGAESVVSVFKTFNCCGSTLRRLRLVMEFPVQDFLLKDGPDHFMTGVVRLELPRLEWILINVVNTNLRNIDFLLQLGSLKELGLRYQKMARDCKKGNAISIRSSVSEEGVIQFVGYEDRLYESNIWKLLPELRLISIKVTIVLAELMQESGGLVLRMTSESQKILNYTRDGYKQQSRQ